MEPKGDKPGDDRGMPTRASLRVSIDNGEEELDLALAGLVADGFRPTHSSGAAGPSTPSLTSASSTTLLPDESPASSSRTGRPSSTAKPQIPQYVLAVRPEPDALSRQTTASTEPYLPVDSPYQGPTAPTQPYHMYPQNVRAGRTLSIMTFSTLPMSESSRGPSQPDDTIQSAAIPLGFRALPDQYRRRVGPDGEEIADMIGPDGHTEQLPPYTRYPDEAYVRKAVAVESASNTVQETATVAPPVLAMTVPGAGGIGLATRNPEFESTDDLGSPRSPHSTRSFASDDSHRRIRLDDEGISEKKKPPKKWQAWMRRKLWGIIPYWAICLTGLVLLVMATILGAVIASFVSKQKRPPPWKNKEWELPSDTTPISPPPDLQPLVTGNWSIPLLPNRITNTCLRNPELSQAWSCHIVISGMRLTVVQEGSDYRASLDCNHGFTMMNNVYAYGEQPPLILQPAKLKLVSDKYEPSRGPAWFKVLPFTKTVILPEKWLGSSDGGSHAQRKVRNVASMGGGKPNLKRMGIAERGEKPWVCTWPETYLELFIYPQQNSSFANWPKQPPLSSTSSTTTPDSTSTTSTATPVGASEPPPSSSYPPSGARETHSSNGHLSSSSSSSDDRPYTPQNQPRSPGEPTGPSEQPGYTKSTTTESTTATLTNPFGAIDTGDNLPPLPQPYPRVVKLAERRVSTLGAPRAQCTQVEIQGFGEEARTLRGPDGRPVVVDIEETEPFQPPGVSIAGTSGDNAKRSSFGGEWWEEEAMRAVVAARGDDGGGGGGGGDGGPPGSSCGCVWFLT